jgi:hypothetical protein
MDRRRVNRDFHILDDYRRRQLAAGRPAWSRHTWRILGDSSFELFLYDFPLPPNARPRTTHVKIEGRSSLYDPAGEGQFHFFRNVWLGNEVKVLIPGQQAWGRLPRLHDQDAQGWFYICVHPGTVRRDENILSLIRVLDLFVLNADPRVW